MILPSPPSPTVRPTDFLPVVRGTRVNVMPTTTDCAPVHHAVLALSDGMPDERTAVVMKATADAPMAWLDLPISVGLVEGGIAAGAYTRPLVNAS